MRHGINGGMNEHNQTCQAQSTENKLYGNNINKYKTETAAINYINIGFL